MPAVSSRGRGRRAINEPNMVPFIDVMLVLLIIFMVTAPLISPSMISLPSVGSAAKQPDAVIQIVLSKENKLEIRGVGPPAATNLDELPKAVKRMQASRGPDATAVVISADKSVQYERVVKVMDTLQRAGIARIGLSVQLTP